MAAWYDDGLSSRKPTASDALIPSCQLAAETVHASGIKARASSALAPNTVRTSEHPPSNRARRAVASHGVPSPRRTRALGLPILLPDPPASRMPVTLATMI